MGQGMSGTRNVKEFQHMSYCVKAFPVLDPSRLGEEISSDTQEQRNVVAGELWQIDLRKNSENSESKRDRGLHSSGSQLLLGVKL